MNRRVDEDGVTEDVLVVSHLREAADHAGGQLEERPYPQPLYREGVNQTLYYALLSRVPRPSKCTVSTINLVLRRID